MSEPTFTDSEVVTGMCLWEAWQDLISDNRHEGATTEAVDALRIQEYNGAFTVRQMLVGCIEDCHEAWALADALEPGGYPGSFDWDFVPDWLRGAVASGRFNFS